MLVSLNLIYAVPGGWGTWRKGRRRDGWEGNGKIVPGYKHYLIPMAADGHYDGYILIMKFGINTTS